MHTIKLLVLIMTSSPTGHEMVIPNPTTTKQYFETKVTQIKGNTTLAILYAPLLMATTIKQHAQHPAVQFVKTLTSMLYISTILLVSHLVYLQEENANDFKYVPKSKRWTKAYRMTAYLHQVTTNAIQTIQDKLSDWSPPVQPTRQTRNRLARNATRKFKTNNPRTIVQSILALSTVVAMSSTLQRPKERQVRFDTDSAPCGIDNRCSACISHVLDDFEGPLVDCNRVIKGFGGTRHFNIQMGTLNWAWENDKGERHKFLIPNSYYIPQGKVRLLSPQHWAKTQQRKRSTMTHCQTDHEKVTLSWHNNHSKKTVPLGKNDNVATFDLAPGYKQFDLFCQAAAFSDEDETSPLLAHEINIIPDDTEADDITTPFQPSNVWKEGDNQSQQSTPTSTDMNIDTPQTTDSTMPRKYNIPIVEDDAPTTKAPTTVEAELLRYHQQFGHISFERLKEMAKIGVIPKHLAKCHTPACAACLYAKTTKRPWRQKQRNNFKPITATEPGELVSVDQLVSPTPGFIAQMTGRLTTKRYKYATVYVDHASRLGYVHLQKTATAEETIEGKQAFEVYAKDRGVTIKAYHADNGIFRANKWKAECTKHGQTLTFAGVNAHHTNGKAEKRIRDLQDLARTQMIHAAHKWKGCVTAHLWPYAIKMANDALNNSPSPQDKARRSPEQVFSKTVVHVNSKHYHPFGCPAFVLENELQGNKPFHKWKERAKVGIYLGKSPQHGRNVALILDRTTGLVSPQFHVQFDSSFSVTQQDRFNSQWQIKAGLAAEKGKRGVPKTPPKETAQANPPINKEAVPTPEGVPLNKRVRFATTSTMSNKRPKTQSENPGLSQPRDEPAAAPTPTGNPTSKPSEMEQAEPKILKVQASETTSTASQPSDQPLTQPALIEAATLEICSNNNHNDEYVEGEIFCFTTLCPDGENPIENNDPLYVYKTTADPDTLYHHEAMKEPDKAEFKKAMQKEIDDRMRDKNFSVILKSELPQGATVLPAVWQLRRKRDIKTRKIKKYKARLNIDGSRMQKGVHYDQSYAPVASWNSIRMLLTMTAVHGWHTKQLDYVAAFPQAPIERELYMKVPRGVEVEGGNSEDHVLKLHKNTYGQKNAGRVWNQYLVKKLITEVGFRQSKVDECVFYHGKVMYVLYTDDSILAGPDPKEIDRLIAKMRKAKLDITIEGDLEDFLGVNIDRKSKDEIHLTQPHLIDAILRDLNLDGEGVKTKDTPASSSRILMRHSDSTPFDESFNYRSVIGKLNYLERGSRSDIAYIVHQCARFTSDPKIQHGKAIMWLGRYLLKTRDKGTILKPIIGKDMEVYVDADFAGNFDKEDTASRDTARSRHGYLIMYQNCPITWKSQLQTEITLSSTESEYTGLSHALRDAIPLMQILSEMKRVGFPIGSTRPKVMCKVFEDNSGALEMAVNHKYRPRTKHLNVKLHHFRDYVTRKEITIEKINTLDQLADYLTKPVTIEILSPLRKIVMGW